MVKVNRDGSTIRLTVITSEPLSDDAKEALSIAAAEIVADFPGCRIEERVTVTTGPLPAEDVLAEGWVYQRAESAGGRDRLDAWHDGSAICVIAVGAHGDPLDLGEGEAEELVAKLQTALAKDRL
ncbi:MAG: hypothetical protein ACXU8Z_10755 [Caulobacteraceae bacterium]